PPTALVRRHSARTVVWCQSGNPLQLAEVLLLFASHDPPFYPITVPSTSHKPPPRSPAAVRSASHVLLDADAAARKAATPGATPARRRSWPTRRREETRVPPPPPVRSP